jgi:hypothetical protein
VLWGERIPLIQAYNLIALPSVLDCHLGLQFVTTDSHSQLMVNPPSQIGSLPLAIGVIIIILHLCRKLIHAGFQLPRIFFFLKLRMLCIDSIYRELPTQECRSRKCIYLTRREYRLNLTKVTISANYLQLIFEPYVRCVWRIGSRSPV